MRRQYVDYKPEIIQHTTKLMSSEYKYLTLSLTATTNTGSFIVD